jgi:hypothetical protein
LYRETGSHPIYAGFDYARMRALAKFPLLKTPVAKLCGLPPRGRQGSLVKTGLKMCRELVISPTRLLAKSRPGTTNNPELLTKAAKKAFFSKIIAKEAGETKAWKFYEDNGLESS